MILVYCELKDGKIRKPSLEALSEARRMADACRAANRQLMDGVMFVHSRRMDSLRAVLDAIQRCGTILSSSLHGLIFAQVFRKPRARRRCSSAPRKSPI